MGTKMKVGAAALLSLMTTSQAFAGFFPLPPAPAAVPEFDGSSGIAAIALLVSVGAILFGASRNK
jgi:hypothetical protein